MLSDNLLRLFAKDNVVEYALQYAAQLQPLHDSNLDVLAQDIRQDVHGDYYLADIVEKGVAYHMCSWQQYRWKCVYYGSG